MVWEGDRGNPVPYPMVRPAQTSHVVARHNFVTPALATSRDRRSSLVVRDIPFPYSERSGSRVGVTSFDVILAQIDPAKRSRSVYVYDIPSNVVKFRDGIEENELRIKRKYQPSRVAA